MSLPSQVVKLLIRASGVKRMFNSEAAMKRFVAHVRPKQERDPPYRTEANFVIDRRQVHSRPVYHLQPRDAPQLPKKHILFLHGGAYVHVMLWLHWSFLNRLSQLRPCQFTVPLYGLGPEHTYREGFELLLEVYREMLEQSAPEDIVFMGDSSGGGMSLALAELLKEKGLPQPSGVVMLSPWLDLDSSNPEIEQMAGRDPLLAAPGARAAAKMWSGGDDLKQPMLSPLYGDLRGLAPLCLFIGTDDLLMPDCRRLRIKADDVGQPLQYHEYESMFHVWMLLPLPESKQALQQIVEFIEHPLATAEPYTQAIG